MKRLRAGILLMLSMSVMAQAAEHQRWSEKTANDWYAKQPWLVGVNYIPADAINQLEMWQADSFDPKRIDLELGWAVGLGMNTMRVFLHDLLWQQDSAGFQKRIDTFLSVAAKHKIRPLFVLFDSCWDPFPRLGMRRAPRLGVHNSGWVQNPGAAALKDPAQYSSLEAYVKGIVGAFAHDPRVLGWDVWNEPGNLNDSSYGKLEPANRTEQVLGLLPRVFTWARAAGPDQPLTCGVWEENDWSPLDKLSALGKVQLEISDVISSHNYDVPAVFEEHLKSLLGYHRPILCTEYMARGNGSTFQGILPIAKKHKVAAINWGFVAGKTQTYLPWDSWEHPYTERHPKVWFHEIFRTDGTPYRSEEVKFIREMTGQTADSTAGRWRLQSGDPRCAVSEMTPQMTSTVRPFRAGSRPQTVG